jgi:hypothetical protein
MASEWTEDGVLCRDGKFGAECSHYERMGGTHCSDEEHLVRDIAWYATYNDAVAAAKIEKQRRFTRMAYAGGW